MKVDILVETACIFHTDKDIKEHFFSTVYDVYVFKSD